MNPSIGPSTIAVYISAIVSVLTPVFAEAINQEVGPVWIYYIASAFLVGLNNFNRSIQAKDLPVIVEDDPDTIDPSIKDIQA